MKRSIAWLLALVMLVAVLPGVSAAAREPKLKVNTAQLTANTEAPNRFKPLSDFVEEYPYWVQPTFRTYGMSVVAGRTMELSADFYCENLKKTDIIGVMIFEGRYDELADDAEPVATMAEYATPSYYSYTYYYSWDTTGMEEGDYTAYFVVVSKDGELLTANVADLYVSDVEIPVTGLEIYVHQMDDTPDLIALQSYGGFDMDIIYEPYHTTSPRKAAVLDGWGVGFTSTDQVGAGWGCSAYRLDEKDGFLLMGYKEDVPGVTETPTDRMEIVLRTADQMADLQGNVNVCIGGTKEYSLVLPEGAESVALHNSNPYLLEIVDYADGVVTVRGLGSGSVALSAIYDNGIDMHHLSVRAHDYLEHWRNAMCEEDGRQWWECRNCGHVKDERVLPATGCIILGSHRVVTPPKATKEGVGEGYCTVCGKAGPYPLDPIFTDTDPEWFYSDPLDYCYENGIINGLTANTFGPNVTLNRAQLVVMLYRHAGSPAVEGENVFADVPAGTFYTDAVVWASQNGIVNGYEDGTFRPGNEITREQLVTMIYRYVVMLGKDSGQRNDLSAFKDLDQLREYAREPMEWGVGTGVINGLSATLLGPQYTANRAQTVTILYRIITGILAE